jgi:hypothetical protein
MFYPSTKKFFLYGLAIAGLEEFITQGVLKGSYFFWVFTLIPFVVFLGIAGCARAVLNKLVNGWRAATLYYAVTGGIGLAVEWFIIGLSPWSDRSSPPLLIALFHAGMFSFWGTVALAPHILLNCRPETAALQRRLRWTLGILMAVTYVLALTAKALGAPEGIQFSASIWPVVVTFLAMNVFYVQYFRSCGRSTRLVPPRSEGTRSSVTP